MAYRHLKAKWMCRQKKVVEIGHPFDRVSKISQDHALVSCKFHVINFYVNHNKCIPNYEIVIVKSNIFAVTTVVMILHRECPNIVQQLSPEELRVVMKAL